MNKPDGCGDVFRTYSVACDIQDEDERGEGVLSGRVGWCSRSAPSDHPHFFDP